jgi:hypothetical protein
MSMRLPLSAAPKLGSFCQNEHRPSHDGSLSPRYLSIVRNQLLGRAGEVLSYSE